VVDVVGAEDLAGVEVDYGDGGLVDEREDAFAAVVGSDAEVVQRAGAAQALSFRWFRCGRIGSGSGA